MTNKKLPEFLVKVADADGNMLGHVAFAHGLLSDEEGATYKAEELFAEVSGRKAFGKCLPVSNMLEAPTAPASLNDVLFDVLYANDCCALTVAELPLASHVRDAEVTCQYCHASYRYTWDDDEKNLIWNWRLQRRETRRNSLVRNLGEVLEEIKKAGENPNDEAYPDEGPDCG